MIKDSLRSIVRGCVKNSADLMLDRLWADVSPEPLQQQLDAFGEALVPPPDEAFDGVEVCELAEVDGRPRARARMPLWTESGPSDLMVEIEADDDEFPFAVKDVRLYRAGERPTDESERWEALGRTVWRTISSLHPTGRQSLRGSLGIVADILAAGNYESVSRQSHGVLSAEDIERKVAELGEPLVRPPDEAFDDVEAIVLDDDPQGRAHVRTRFALWTASGPSDLYLEERALHTSTGWAADSMKLYRAGEEPDDEPGRWERVGR